MEGFSSYEEMISKYPLDGFSNVIWKIDKRKLYCPTDEDLRILRVKFPYGYFDNTRTMYICFVPWAICLYDSYLYDGEAWFLAESTWEGYQKVLHSEIVEAKAKKGNYCSKKEAEAHCLVLSSF